MSQSRGPEEEIAKTLPECDLPPLDEFGLEIDAYGLSDKGMVRKANEDQFLVGVLKNAIEIQNTGLPQASVHLGRHRLGHLLVVADGVGGSVGGSHASSLAVDTIEEFIVSTIDWCNQLNTGESYVFQGLTDALKMADSRVIHEGEVHPGLAGMGTTMTLAYCRGRDMFLAHVGDSRCYLLRHEKLILLTRDHTVANEMARQGMLDPEDVEKHPLNNVITNVVGGSEEGTQVDVSRADLVPGDIVLLCTDGLTKMVKDEELPEILKEATDSRAACEHLIKLSNDRGGKDNVTVIVARILATGPETVQHSSQSNTL